MLGNDALPKRRLGKTAVEVTALGLGGEGLLRTWGRQQEAVDLIRRALELGITYFDSAPAYAGSEDYHGDVWGTDPNARARVFLCSKSASRTRDKAYQDLQLTLQRMRTSHLDLWQVHDLRTEEEWAELKAPGGALEAFVEAKKQGLTRFIGITGHHDPYLLARAIREFDFDTVLLPVNVPEAALPGFLDETIPAAQERDLGIVGMKVLGGGYFPRMQLPASALIRFALARPVSTIIVGCNDILELETNIKAAEAPPLSAEQEKILINTLRPYAKQAAYYRGPLLPAG